MNRDGAVGRSACRNGNYRVDRAKIGVKALAPDRPIVIERVFKAATGSPTGSGRGGADGPGQSAKLAHRIRELRLRQGGAAGCIEQPVIERYAGARPEGRQIGAGALA